MKEISIKLTYILLSLFLAPGIANADNTKDNIFEVYGYYYVIQENDPDAVSFSLTEIKSESTNQGGLNQGGVNFDDPWTPSIVEIPSSITYNGKTYAVTAIHKSAFKNCSYLKKVIIPATVKQIGDYAFEGCESLAEVINYATTPQPINSTAFAKYGTLMVEPQCKEAYKSSDYWKNFNIMGIGEEVSIENTNINLQNNQTIYGLNGLQKKNSTKGFNIIKSQNNKAIKIIK